METTLRILSIQSHTIHGYVGNKAATFPLQLCGYNVDCINTIALSNHPAYPAACKGESLNEGLYKDFLKGLENNKLLRYNAVLTGYVRHSELLTEMSKSIQTIKQTIPSTIYVCDPVLGDNGTFYVPEVLVSIYKQDVIPLASVITPNIFESQVLSGIQINNFEQAMEACEKLHDLGPSICILKGLKLSNEPKLSILLSIRKLNEEIFPIQSNPSNDHLTTSNHHDDHVVYRIDVPLIIGSYSGTGDVFSALITACLLELQDILQIRSNVLAEGIRCVSELMSKLIDLTRKSGSRELCIIESRNEIIEFSNALKELKKGLIHSSNVDEISKDSLIQMYKAAYHMETGRSMRDRAPLGIIFDMDGTLTEPGAIDFQAMYQRIGLEKSDEDLMTRVLQWKDDPKMVHRYHEALKIIFEEEMIGCEKMILRNNIKELLKLSKKNNIRMAIATRNCEETCDLFMKKLLLPTTTFDMIIHRDSLSGINKPDPVVAQHILKKWDILPSMVASVWFVGDSLDDMKCGKNAGCSTCLIRTSYNRQLSSEFPGLIDLKIDDLCELLNR